MLYDEVSFESHPSFPWTGFWEFTTSLSKVKLTARQNTTQLFQQAETKKIIYVNNYARFLKDLLKVAPLPKICTLLLLWFSSGT